MNANRCSRCDTEVPEHVTRCPACKGLMHASRLTTLVGLADDAAASGQTDKAAVWLTEARQLLPDDAHQVAAIEARLAQLGRDGSPPRPDKDAALKERLKKLGPVLGAVVLAVWKFKFVLGFVATKGKLLLAGLTKGGTLFSMLASMGVYWTLWGWKFAAGLVISIYIHEMGHVAALRRFGIKATAPMFIPGVGAFVRMKQMPATNHQNAVVGLAGPWWGLTAALVARAVALGTGWPAWAAIAQFGAFINLFNLLPFGPLDGGRGFQALNRTERWLACGAIGAVWFFTSEPLLLLLLIAGVAQTFQTAPETSDRRILIEYAVLVGTLSWLATLPVGV